MRRLVCIAFLLIFSCKKEYAVAADNKMAAAVDTAQTATTMPARNVPSSPAASAPLRLIVRTAEVHAVVSDVTRVMNELTKIAESVGGYGGDSKIWRDGEQLRATITLRVPATKLNETMAALRKSAVRIESENVSSDDVSQEYVDLASQLRNAEAAETELRELMKDVRVKTKRAADVLEMYQQLTTVQGEIEKTKGRMQFLSQSAAMSTLRVELIPDAILKPVVESGWQPVVIMKNASRALVSTLQALATMLIWLLLYVVPIALIFVVPVVVVVRRFRRVSAAPRGA